MKLAPSARTALLCGPTPLEPMPNLSRALGGPALYIKRDDCTGLALGGNKTRKLEFLLTDAMNSGANHLITHGAVQSNHVRQTAAAAARLGLRFTGLLEHRIAEPTAGYLENGNALLTRMLGARLVHCPRGTDMERAMQEVAESVRRTGERPYVIPGGGSNAIGTLGYAACADELLLQARAAGLRMDCIVHPTGSGGTQAGLVAGLAHAHSATKVLGISVKAPRDQQERNVHDLSQAAANLLDPKLVVERRSVEVDDGCVGPGYGQPTPEMVEAVELVARLEGILLDPVYTGKAMAALIALVRSGYFAAKDTVVFLHTGGAPSLFGYHDLFTNEHADERQISALASAGSP